MHKLLIADSSEIFISALASALKDQFQIQICADGQSALELLQQEKPSIFFTPELCTRYFSYTKDQVAHFVLFDDAETLRRKLKLGAQFGFSAAFFMWPEIKDLADSLLK